MCSDYIKKIVISLGADLCKIAGIERFEDAPEGYHPRDVLPSCNSVISFACRFPAGNLACRTAVPYTRVRNSITAKMDAIALDLCIELEKMGFLAVPVPTNESQWDDKTGRWRSIVSQKHAAQAAGLGTIGRHSLLITPEFGSMVWLGAVLTEAELAEDPVLEKICNDCNLCVEACPITRLKKQNLTSRYVGKMPSEIMRIPGIGKYTVINAGISALSTWVAKIRILKDNILPEWI